MVREDRPLSATGNDQYVGKGIVVKRNALFMLQDEVILLPHLNTSAVLL